MQTQCWIAILIPYEKSHVMILFIDCWVIKSYVSTKGSVMPSSLSSSNVEYKLSRMPFACSIARDPFGSSDKGFQAAKWTDWQIKLNAFTIPKDKTQQSD